MQFILKSSIRVETGKRSSDKKVFLENYEMEINLEQYLSRFKVFNSPSLFPPTQEEFLKDVLSGKCPHCKRKIYWKADKSLGYCKSKVKDGFVITRNAYSKLGGGDK